jgi:hypothetical protein
VISNRYVRENCVNEIYRRLLECILLDLYILLELLCGATSRTAPGSIPGGVTGDFFSVVPPTEPCASESEYQGFLQR